MDLNKITLIGTLPKNPISNTLPSGMVTTFEIDTSYIYGNGQKTERHSVIARGRLAEVIDGYVKKGSRVYVEGKLMRNSEIIADNLIMLGKDKTKHQKPRNINLSNGTKL